MSTFALETDNVIMLYNSFIASRQQNINVLSLRLNVAVSIVVFSSVGS